MQKDSLDFPAVVDGEDKSCPFKNCLRNNYKHARKWAKRTQTNCFRIYDKQLAHYPLAIDFYAGRYCIHYFAPKGGDSEPPAELITAVEERLVALFGAEPTLIFWRSRIKRDKLQQYERSEGAGEQFVVHEYGVPFWVNLTDYLDTGLFLDHRETRQRVAKSIVSKRLLNLFAYTGSFSVHAAIQGAAATHSVDLSNTYCDWARRNLELNELNPAQHTVERADCLRFLREAARRPERYDVIVIDPPTLSRSKKMEGFFDVVTDYPTLIQGAQRLLRPGGIIFFSTNARRFKFDVSLFPNADIQEISSETVPFDFQDRKIHRCWMIK